MHRWRYQGWGILTICAGWARASCAGWARASRATSAHQGGVSTGRVSYHGATPSGLSAGTYCVQCDLVIVSPGISGSAASLITDYHTTRYLVVEAVEKLQYYDH